MPLQIPFFQKAENIITNQISGEKILLVYNSIISANMVLRIIKNIQISFMHNDIRPETVGIHLYALSEDEKKQNRTS